jgi:hypothetical protein
MGTGTFASLIRTPPCALKIACKGSARLAGVVRVMGWPDGSSVNRSIRTKAQTNCGGVESADQAGLRWSLGRGLQAWPILNDGWDVATQRRYFAPPFGAPTRSCGGVVVHPALRVGPGVRLVLVSRALAHFSERLAFERACCHGRVDDAAPVHAGTYQG